MTKSIKAISFDLDNTLWHAEPVLQQAEKAMAEWLLSKAPDVHDLLKQKVRLYRHQLLSMEPQLEHRVSDIRRRVLYCAARDAGRSDDESTTIAGDAFDVFYSHRQRVTLFEPVESVLRELSKQFRLISITNGNSNPEVIGIAPFFEFSLSAESEGVGKPSQVIFQRAIDRLGVTPQEVIHVGDHPVDDVQGAANAGIKTVWFNYLKVEPAQPADAEIDCISELPEAVASLLNRHS